MRSVPHTPPILSMRGEKCVGGGAQREYGIYTPFLSFPPLILPFPWTYSGGGTFVGDPSRTPHWKCGIPHNPCTRGRRRRASGECMCAHRGRRICRPASGRPEWALVALAPFAGPGRGRRTAMAPVLHEVRCSRGSGFALMPGRVPPQGG